MHLLVAPPLRRLPLAAGLVLLPSLLRAQPAPAAPAAAEPEKIVHLDAYTVTTTLGRYTDTTTTAAMKMPVAQVDLPFSVQVLNRAFLDDVRSSRLEDAFGYVVGLNKQGTNANAFTLRGFSAAGSNLQSIQVDGLPGPPSRFASPPTVNVERLEVIKGPTSVLYGQANPGGLLNIVTKSPQARAQTSLSVYASTYASGVSGLGDDNSLTTSLDTTGPLDAAGRWLYRVVASYEDKNSFRDYGFERNQYLYPSLTYRWSRDTFVTLKTEYVREDRHADDGLAVPFLNAALLPARNVSYQAPDARDTDYGESASLAFQTRVLDAWTVRAAYRTTYHTDSRYALETAQGAIVSNATNYRLSTIRPRFRIQENTKRYNFVDANAVGEFTTGRIKHSVILGANGGHEFLDTNRKAFGPQVTPVNLYVSAPDAPGNYALTPSGLQDRRSDFWNYGLYASDVMKFGERFDASLGWRWDKQDSYQLDVIPNEGIKPTESKSLPSLGLVFHPTSAWSIYGSYCEGFKPQAPGNVDANDNPNFPPETSSQVEAGVKLELPQHGLTATVALYDIKKRNVLTSTGKTAPSGNTIANLSGLQESRGVEVSGAWLPKPYWQVQFGYTYIDATVKTSTTATLPGALLDNTPHHGASLWTRYNVPTGKLKGLGFGFGAVYAGKRQAIITNVATARLELPGYTRADVSAYYRTKHFDYALNVGNVFDRTYLAGAMPGGADRLNPGEPRKITFSVRYLF
ncbi:TonB-dependent siderophore receptor [Oleiharenicola sp. Vm1]|uniref:TonB-dependent siderophore receptor n=1 Tax=Oleiharenicola sp. Vm1 TaxID=3398393 RepID=UPI0039F4511B